MIINFYANPVSFLLQSEQPTPIRPHAFYPLMISINYEAMNNNSLICINQTPRLQPHDLESKHLTPPFTRHLGASNNFVDFEILRM